MPDGAVSQFPKRTPLEATPFTRVMPLASSGACSPLSAAFTASFRTAVIRTLMETAPSPRVFSATRQAATVALVQARPRLLGVPGEELVKLPYDLHEPAFLPQASDSTVRTCDQGNCPDIFLRAFRLSIKDIIGATRSRGWFTGES